jgi:hypothetical protein
MPSSRWYAPAALMSLAGSALCTRSTVPSASTAFMKVSVTPTDTLKLVRSPLSLAWMNCSMSG